VAACCTDGVVRYFLAPNVGAQPVTGAEHLGRYWRTVHGMIDAEWLVHHGIEVGDEAHDSETEGMRRFVRHVNDDQRTKNVVLTVGDGLMLIWKT
jgi:hypothetical protein